MELTPEQMKNLEVFMSRVQLTGAEVGAFNNLVNAIFGEKIIKPVKPEEKQTFENT